MVTNYLWVKFLVLHWIFYLLLTPNIALTPNNRVLIFPCPTMKVTSKRFRVKDSDEPKSSFLCNPASVVSFLYTESNDSASNFFSACKLGAVFLDLNDAFLSFSPILFIAIEVLLFVSSGNFPSKWANARVKSLASCSWPSKRSRTESKSGLEGLIWPIGRQDPRLYNQNKI